MNTMLAPCATQQFVLASQTSSRHRHAPGARAQTAVRDVFKGTALQSKPAAARLTAGRHRSTGVRAAQTAEAGKLISSVEIPAFIPRPDLLEQLVRWALSTCQQDGAANFGLPMRVEPFHNKAGDDWGFIISIVRDGATLTQIGVMFDEEMTTKSEWVGRGADGFPIQEGRMTEVTGKNLLIRKLDDEHVDDELRACIRRFCETLVSALNKYYAFGSCFTDDTT